MRPPDGHTQGQQVGKTALPYSRGALLKKTTVPMPKPSDFFVGVIDLFAVLLPGAALLLVVVVGMALPSEAAPRSLWPTLTDDPGVKWMVLFLASYLLGHVLAAVGGWILDPVYDRYYRDGWKGAKSSGTSTPHSPQQRIHVNARGESVPTLSARERRGQGYKALKSKAKSSAQRDWTMDEIDNVGLHSIAETYVRANSGPGSAEVQRMAADSKFFRSIILVALAAIAAIALNGSILFLPGWWWLEVAILAGLVAVAIWRFFELRWKGVQFTYQYFVTLRATEPREQSR